MGKEKKIFFLRVQRDDKANSFCDENSAGAKWRFYAIVKVGDEIPRQHRFYQTQIYTECLNCLLLF